jgi:hypothetical protein
MEKLHSLSIIHPVSIFIRKNERLYDLLLSYYEERMSVDLMELLIQDKNILEYIFFNESIIKYKSWKDAIIECENYRIFRLKWMNAFVGFHNDDEVDKFMAYCDTLNLDSIIHEIVPENGIQAPVFYISAYSRDYTSVNYEKINMFCQIIQNFLNIDTLAANDEYYAFHHSRILINSRCYPSIHEANKVVDSVINHINTEHNIHAENYITKLELNDDYGKKYTIQCAKTLVKREIIEPLVIILSDEPIEVAKRWTNNLSESRELSKYSVSDLYKYYASNNINVVPIRKFNEIVCDLRYRKVKKDGDDYWTPMYGCKECSIKK